jgi:hypothetical protein
VSGSVTVTRIVDPEDWESYRGQWVAIREGQIVAAAIKLDDLYADERVQQSDGVARVPEDGVHFFSSATRA